MNDWIQLTIPFEFDTIKANQQEREHHGSKM
jgi:hypothetical protein